MYVLYLRERAASVYDSPSTAIANASYNTLHGVQIDDFDWSILFIEVHSK